MMRLVVAIAGLLAVAVATEPEWPAELTRLPQWTFQQPGGGCVAQALVPGWLAGLLACSARVRAL